MDAMWSASTKKIVGVGLDDWNFAQGISTLTGAHFVGRGSYSKSNEATPTASASSASRYWTPPRSAP